MRLLSLDYEPVYDSENTLAAFDDDVSLFDYDVVIWDPSSSFSRYYLGFGYGERHQGLPLLSESASVSIRADAKRRRSGFAEFINIGRTVVVIVRPPQQCYIDTGKKEYSGTGRNRVTTKIVAPFDLMSAVPSDCEFSPMSGNQIDLDGDGPIIRLLRKYKEYFTYQSVIAKPPGTILARITGTNKVIGSILRSEGGGYLIMLPAPDFRAQTDDGTDDDEEEEEEKDTWLPDAAAFQYELLAAIEQLNGNASLSRPLWAERYATDDQQRLQTEVVKQQKRVETARAKLAAVQQQREIIDAKDQLFLGTGRALELEVRKVLKLLGGTVTEPSPGREDWRVSFPEGDAVLEVKGVTKTAAEKQAAQLAKWVASTFEETEKLPKGILVVNTWRELPLDERTDKDFPDQMLPYSVQQGHCLVTGLQLFMIQAEVEKDASRGEYWRKQLLDTTGELVGADDWRSIIHEVKTED